MVSRIAQDLSLLAFCWCKCAGVLTILGGASDVGSLFQMQLTSGLLVRLLGVPESVTEWGASWYNSPVVAGLCVLSLSSPAPVWMAFAVWPGNLSDQVAHSSVLGQMALIFPFEPT